MVGTTPGCVGGLGGAVSAAKAQDPETEHENYLCLFSEFARRED